MATMNASTDEKPRFNLLEGVKSLFAWVAIAFTIAGFMLSPLTLPVWLYVLIAAAIIGIAYLIYFGLYAVRYVKYLQGKEKKLNSLIELYGKKESELLRMKEEVRSVRRRQIWSFFLGAKRGIEAKSNESLALLVDEDIDILGKRYGTNGFELIFNKGTKAGIEQGTLLSILTTVYGDLWGVVEIHGVSEDDCKGHPVSRLNRNFWSRVEKDAAYDQSPPPSVKARLYCEEHLMNELKATLNEIEAS